MSDPVGKFIAVVELHFPKPRFEDDDVEKAWMGSMMKFLSPYSSAVLSDSAEYILQNRKPKTDGKFFPAPSEIIEVCKMFDGLERAKSKTPLLSHGRKDKSEWAGWRVELANDLIKTAPEAAKKQGWIGALWSFCRKFGRMPEGSREVAKIQDEARNFDEALAVCEAGEAGPLSRPLAQLGRSMKDRRESLARGEPVTSYKVVAPQFGKSE